LQGSPVATSTCPAGQFNPLTGQPCSTGTPVSTCPVGALFNPQTGASCTGTTTTTVNSTAAGNISADSTLGGFNNTIVGVGDVNHQVAGLQLTGAGGGSNLNLNYATVQLVAQTGSGSSRVSDYFTSVGLWENGVQVGTVPASAFTSNNISGINNYVYSASIPLSGATVVAGQQSNFYVTVSALPSMDSANYNQTWAVSVNNIRFTDGTGATLTYNPSSILSLRNTGNTLTFSFGSAANANNVVLNVARASSDQNSHTVTVNTNGNSTSKVPLLQIGLTTQGGQTVSVNKIPVVFTATGTSTSAASSSTGSSGGAVWLGALTNEVYLMNGTTVLDSESIAANAPSGTVVDFKISSANPLLVSTPMTLTVAADVNSTTGGAYTGGATLAAATKLGMTTDTYVSNGWDLTVGSPNGSSLLTYTSTGNANTVIPGTANGQKVAFYATGVSVAETSDACTATNSSGASDTSSMSCTIAFSVTANGAPAYMPKVGYVGVTGGTVDGTNKTGSNFLIEKSDGTFVAGSASVSQVGTNAISGTDWNIPAGTTAQFTATVVFSDTNNAHPGLYRAYLAGVPWGTATTVYGNSYTFNLDDTNTAVPGYVYIY
jgi:hypothetical protein